MPTYHGIFQLPAMALELAQAPRVHTGEWQSMNTERSPAHETHELEDVTFMLDMGIYPELLAEELKPDLPWADEHFAERVSGIPYNPPPSAARWPYAVRNHADHTDDAGRFDHTYPERFWPKHGGMAIPPGYTGELPPDYYRQGIRFAYGDLNDVVNLLIRSPFTRQAYLPVWFPEDTGAVEGQRVPCTLGYHFMMRDNRLSCRYYIRSCDIKRHFVNDVYFACRLTQWIAEQVNSIATVRELPTPPIAPGRLVMHISSLHCFVGDRESVVNTFYDKYLPWRKR